MLAENERLRNCLIFVIFYLTFDNTEFFFSFSIQVLHIIQLVAIKPENSNEGRCLVKSRRFRERLKRERPEALAAYRIKERERARRKRYRDKIKNMSKAQIKNEHYYEEILP